MDVHDDSKLLKINDPFFFYISEISKSSLMNSSYIKSLDASIYIFPKKKGILLHNHSRVIKSRRFKIDTILLSIVHIPILLFYRWPIKSRDRCPSLWEIPLCVYILLWRCWINYRDLVQSPRELFLSILNCSCAGLTSENAVGGRTGLLDGCLWNEFELLMVSESTRVGEVNPQIFLAVLAMVLSLCIPFLSHEWPAVTLAL